MELASSRTVPASVEATWAALNDPQTLKECITGCESIERVSDTEFQVKITTRIGPVAAKFDGCVVLADLAPPSSYRMSFEGQGGAAGFARGEARVALAPDGAGGTRIEYRASAQVGGKLAQVGARLIDGAAAKVADDFFAHFVQRVGGVPVVAAGQGSTPRSLWLWVGLAAAIVLAIAVYWFSRPA